MIVDNGASLQEVCGGHSARSFARGMFARPPKMTEHYLSFAVEDFSRSRENELLAK
jgi:hypothetical protein